MLSSIMIIKSRDLPVYLGSLNDSGVEIRYEDPDGEYIIIEIGDIIYVFYALE